MVQNITRGGSCARVMPSCDVTLRCEARFLMLVVVVLVVVVTAVVVALVVVAQLPFSGGYWPGCMYQLCSSVYRVE